MLTIQARFKHIAEQNKLSIKELASKLSVPYTSLKNALDKSNNEMNTKYCTAISENFNINLNWLLTGTGTMFLETPSTSCPHCNHPITIKLEK